MRFFLGNCIDSVVSRHKDALLCYKVHGTCGEVCVLPAGMQVDSGDKAEAKTGGTDGEKDSTADGGKDGSAEGQAEGQKAKAAKEPEPSSHSLDNPARVVPAQEKLVKFPEGSRYMPIRSGRTAGILLLKDSTPGIQSFPPARHDSDCRLCMLFLFTQSLPYVVLCSTSYSLFPVSTLSPWRLCYRAL